MKQVTMIEDVPADIDPVGPATAPNFRNGSCRPSRCRAKKVMW